ncbi:microtubule-associated protein 70-5 isoform X1 [Cucurbita pepo subsp. pepo]|uniref:microtubule-associated protein 70-5 isoform X1 n=1 Tax=Cucurbita pepo subsp. pepo TaxID=3664 RepID=UPI000C9D86F7|nr:microtubule-associated protein 70-5 isoform X1 [Cucurbita pepo subsp. pepo]
MVLNMGSYEEHVGREEGSVVLLDPVVLELNRLQNLVAEKNRELGAAHSEIKALKATEAKKDKALEELKSEVDKLDDKLRATENLLEHKNLEIKRLTTEKKDAVAAQYAAEATLRRVYANQKDDDSLTLASVVAPLEAKIKMYKNEVLLLQEDKKALERLTKSKEAALLEAEKILRSALERALIVEEVQNHNFELKRQIEICQEENRILEKTNRQKVIEVERLGQTIKDLEEAILAGGATANMVRDYKRQIEELHEEKRTLERELARAKVSAHRVATVVANEWKDESDRVMPVKQWLEERKLLQAELQRTKDKLAVSERTAKAEAQLKEKFKLRLKTLEEGLRQIPASPVNTKAFSGSPKTERSNNILGFLTSNGRKRSTSLSKPSSAISKTSNILVQTNASDYDKATAPPELNRSNSLKKKYASACENVMKKSMWASGRSKVVDITEKENRETIDGEGFREPSSLENEDTVSGFLYDKIQKEVINLRKLCEVKDGNLNTKDEEIKVLMKKVDALTKAMEVEAKKMKREAAVKEKEAAAAAAGRLEEKNKPRMVHTKSRRLST